MRGANLTSTELLLTETENDKLHKKLNELDNRLKYTTTATNEYREKQLIIDSELLKMRHDKE
jgi:uncharacterized protein YlxW (UPF0749 family)